MWVDVADEVEFVTEEEFEDSGVPAIVHVAAGGELVNDWEAVEICSIYPGFGRNDIGNVCQAPSSGKNKLGEARLDAIRSGGTLGFEKDRRCEALLGQRDRSTSKKIPRRREPGV